MLRVGVAQAWCDPQVISMAYIPLICSFLDHTLASQITYTLENTQNCGENAILVTTNLQFQ